MIVTKQCKEDIDYHVCGSHCVFTKYFLLIVFYSIEHPEVLVGYGHVTSSG